MLTIAPPPCSRIRGAAALVQINGPVRLTCRMRLQSSSEVSRIGANTATPALLISASSRPKRALTDATAFATALASETSQCSSSVWSGSARPATAPRSNSPSMSSSATRQPSARNRLAVASPMPRAAPVTRAVFCGEEGMGGSVGERKISRSYNPSPVPCPDDNDAEFSDAPGQPACEKNPIRDVIPYRIDPVAALRPLRDRLRFRGGALHARRHLAGDGALFLDRGRGRRDIF